MINIRRYRDHITEYLDNEHKGKWMRHFDTYESIEWNSDYTPPSKTDVETAVAIVESAWDAQAYARNREAEYPTIAELTVALYDTDDKAALETKRAAVKTKWPKDNSGPV